jgi:putative endonuclease
VNLLYRAADALRDRGRRRRWPADLASGRRAEDLTHRYVRARGMTVVARNYRPPSGGGEIDLIAWEGDRLVFIEVKSRATGDFGPPEQAVDREKQRLVERAARDYARRAQADWTRARFDIASVILSEPPRIDYFPDAFEPRRTL